MSRIFVADETDPCHFADMNSAKPDRGPDREPLDISGDIGFKQGLFLPGTSGAEGKEGGQKDRNSDQDEYSDFEVIVFGNHKVQPGFAGCSGSRLKNWRTHGLVARSRSSRGSPSAMMVFVLASSMMTRSAMAKILC